MKCNNCGRELKITDLIIEPDNPIAKCPCGEPVMTEIEHKAICHAEKIGVYEYAVNDDGWFEYWSFFPGEGFRFIQHNLNDGEERRDGFIPWNKEDGIPVPMFLKEYDQNNTDIWWCKYNYNVG